MRLSERLLSKSNMKYAETQKSRRKGEFWAGPKREMAVTT
jgi:hypothetical protein